MTFAGIRSVTTIAIRTRGGIVMVIVTIVDLVMVAVAAGGGHRTRIPVADPGARHTRLAVAVERLLAAAVAQVAPDVMQVITNHGAV